MIGRRELPSRLFGNKFSTSFSFCVLDGYGQLSGDASGAVFTSVGLFGSVGKYRSVAEPAVKSSGRYTPALLPQFCSRRAVDDALILIELRPNFPPMKG